MKLKSSLLALSLLTGHAQAVDIAAAAGLSTIMISTCVHDAGAICSLKWGGKQFIDDHDHGRQLQSASSFDHQGEYFNPTEAGASSLTDGFNPHPSSSRLLYELASGNALTTQTQMAFWNPVNGVKLSNHILTKRVRIGVHGLPHVIEYLTEFEIPPNETHSFATFEVLTGYMPLAFRYFRTLELRSGVINGKASHYFRLDSVTDGPGEQNNPLIFATRDAEHAMGIYSPGSPQPAYKEAGYGRWRHPDVVKWNNVYRIQNPEGTYRFRSYVIVGSLQNVVDSMVSLMKLMPPSGGK